MCKRVFSNQTNNSSGIPFYKIGTVGKLANAFISKELFYKLKLNYKYPKKGDTLISASGTIGKIVEFDGKEAYFQDSNIVWLTSKILIKKYLNYWLCKKPFKPTTGSTIRRLYNHNILSTKIFVPKKLVQQQIIDIIEPNEILFLKYSNCVRIDEVENTKKDMQQIIDIIEPLEKMIFKIENANKLINSIESYLFQYLLKKTINKKVSEIIIEKNKLVDSLLTEVVGVGYKGFRKKVGKISQTCKPVGQWEFAIGLLSKDIPKGLNYKKKTLGVSSAYKTFSAIDGTTIKSWFMYKTLDNNWKKYLKPTSRQGQSFDSKNFLKSQVQMPPNELFLKNELLIKKILGFKNSLKSSNTKLNKLRQNIIFYLIR